MDCDEKPFTRDDSTIALGVHRALIANLACLFNERSPDNPGLETRESLASASRLPCLETFFLPLVRGRITGLVPILWCRFWVCSDSSHWLRCLSCILVSVPCYPCPNPRSIIYETARNWARGLHEPGRNVIRFSWHAWTAPISHLLNRRMSDAWS